MQRQYPKSKVRLKNIKIESPKATHAYFHHSNSQSYRSSDHDTFGNHFTQIEITSSGVVAIACQIIVITFVGAAWWWHMINQWDSSSCCCRIVIIIDTIVVSRTSEVRKIIPVTWAVLSTTLKLWLWTTRMKKFFVLIFFCIYGFLDPVHFPSCRRVITVIFHQYIDDLGSNKSRVANQRECGNCTRDLRDKYDRH